MARSGGVRLAIRSSRLLPLWVLCAQNMSFCAFARAVRPNTANGLYQSATSPATGSANDDPGMIHYDDLAAHFISSPAYTRYWDNDTQAPWIYSARERIFISYDDPQSIGIKDAYIKAHGLAGAMIWELGQDDSKSTLLHAVFGGLH